MKALITAGGRGTRLRPITHTSNKHLIPIANKPMIFYALEAVRDIGISEVGIIVNETRFEVEAVLGSGEDFDLNITYIEQEEPLGLAHCLKISREFLEDEPFLFYLGDNILAGGIAPYAKRFENEDAAALLLLSEVPDPGRFGVAETEGTQIVGIEEKPKEPKSDFAVTGVYFYTPKVWEAVEQIEPSERGELEISDVHQYLIEKNYPIIYENVSGWWKDTGKPEDLLAANHLVLRHLEEKMEGDLEDVEVRGCVAVGRGSKIRNTLLRGPLIIGKDVRVKDSYLGPYTAVSDRAVVVESEIENSIVLENAEVLNLPARLDESIIGKEAFVSRGKRLPRTLRMVIGDQSQIDLV
ncbi:MAG: glucose-1-phosphate thymidylyltransferase [Patescibacteria group bacterium]|nr:glucose-1-phosphate thymidylyltransferase [Patescibacteria group bacterium]